MDGVELLEDNKPILSVNREQFPHHTKDNEYFESEKDTETVNTKLTIAFETRGLFKWKFVFRGNKIDAHIEDRGFIEKVESGERFAQGDVLDVELKIYKEFNKKLNTYLNKKYEILKVNAFTPRNEQMDMNM